MIQQDLLQIFLQVGVDVLQKHLFILTLSILGVFVGEESPKTENIH